MCGPFCSMAFTWTLNGNLVWYFTHINVPTSMVKYDQKYSLDKDIFVIYQGHIPGHLKLYAQFTKKGGSHVFPTHNVMMEYSGVTFSIYVDKDPAKEREPLLKRKP